MVDYRSCIPGIVVFFFFFFRDLVLNAWRGGVFWETIYSGKRNRKLVVSLLCIYCTWVDIQKAMSRVYLVVRLQLHGAKYFSFYIAQHPALGRCGYNKQWYHNIPFVLFLNPPFCPPSSGEQHSLLGGSSINENQKEKTTAKQQQKKKKNTYYTTYAHHPPCPTQRYRIGAKGNHTDIAPEGKTETKAHMWREKMKVMTPLSLKLSPPGRPAPDP